MTELETRTIRKVTRRLIPFLLLCYFGAYLDRVNVGFAHNQMIESLGMSETAYGFGAGMFFIAYFLFEVPSNIWLEKFGARMWIARIMVSWGIVSACFAFIPQISHYTGISNEWTFYILRFTLGVMEAGFYPGIIFYLTLWFPKLYRARMVSLFMLAIPMSSIVGGPLSGALLNLSGWDLEGWQWLYFIEGTPSIVLGVLTFFYLDDFPYVARWLSRDEIDWLQGRLQQEAAGSGHDDHSFRAFLKMMSNPMIVALIGIYTLYVTAGYATTFFLPAIVKAMGLSNLGMGLVVAIPSVCGAIGMTVMGRSSDRHRERKYHLAFALTLNCVGLLGGALAAGAVIRIVFFSIASVGASSMVPIFWTLPPTLIQRGQLAAGIAAVNAVGALGGFFGPSIMGYTKQATGSPTAGLLVMAAFVALAVAITVALRLKREEPAPLVVPTGMAGADAAGR